MVEGERRLGGGGDEGGGRLGGAFWKKNSYWFIKRDTILMTIGASFIICLWKCM